MNKKFTTFLTAMLVLLGFASASAQNPVNNPILERGTPHDLNGARLQRVLQKGVNRGYFQIVWEDPLSLLPTTAPYGITPGEFEYVLAVNTRTGELVLVDRLAPGALDGDITYESTFWCVEVTSEDQSQRPKYDYVNRATGLPLQISMADLYPGYTSSNSIPVNLTAGNETFYTSVPAGTWTNDVELLLGGEISGWSLSPQFNNIVDASYGYMYSTYAPNKVVGFVADIVAGQPNLSVKTVNFNDADGAGGLSQFRLRVEGDLVLSATQINSMMGQLVNNTKGIKLTFDPDVFDTGDKNLDFSNPFTQVNFEAETSKELALAAAGLVHIKQVGATNMNYLKLDTIYHNNTGSRYLKFNWDNLNTRLAIMKADPVSPIPATSTVDNILDGTLIHGMEHQYNFLFTYSPTFDSLYVQVRGAYDIPNGQTWNDAINHSNGRVQHDGTSSPVPYNPWYFEYPYVSIQDLSAGRVLTVHSGNQDTHVSFGFDNCTPVAINKTSIDDGLYFIRNNAKQYLASPIHFNGNDARWETIEQPKVDQEPLHMPAYQWVVLKDRYYSDEVKPTSPITVYNREFPDLEIKMQLSKDENGGVYVSSLRYSGFPTFVGYIFPFDLNDYITFEQITDQKIIEDPYLGYRKFSEDSLLINKYVFNYLHSLNLNTYLNRGTGRDSIVHIGEENKGQFTLRSLKRTTATNSADSLVAVEYTFGFDPAISGNRIKGLSQLKRTPYYIALNNEGTLGRTTEDRYSIGKHVSPNAMGQLTNEYHYPHDTTFFYLKENNHYNGKHYHAAVEFDWSTAGAFLVIGGRTTSIVNHNSIGTGDLWDYKAGVDDAMSADLKIQELETESRTSAFAIGNDESPLYRRFNSADEKVNKDTTVVLRFVEGYRHNEYLQVENNPSFMKKGIDYLGIWTEDRAASGISFYVDSAWINRGAGYVKPQYLILIERETYAGSPAVPCEYEHNHGYTEDGTPADKWTCSHATPAIPGYTRAKYLVNFGGFTSGNLTGRNATAKVLPIQSTTDAEFDNTYRWKGYDRAGFLQAVHIQDTLIILNEKYSKYRTNENGQPVNTLDKMNIKALIADPLNAVFDLRYDHHKYVTWSMRYIEPEKAFLAEDAGKDKRFLMESMKRKVTTSNTFAEPDIAPAMAQWIKMQNGALVLSDPENSYFDQMRESNSSTGGDDALIFDVEVGSEGQIAKDNDEVVSANVVVIGGNGSVTVKNAAGKAVVITNVLGQTIANTVVSSDNATISVPQGIVVVAVEGESAVKAIVK